MLRGVYVFQSKDIWQRFKPLLAAFDPLSGATLLQKSVVYAGLAALFLYAYLPLFLHDIVTLDGLAWRLGVFDGGQGYRQGRWAFGLISVVIGWGRPPFLLLLAALACLCAATTIRSLLMSRAPLAGLAITILISFNAGYANFAVWDLWLFTYPLGLCLAAAGLALARAWRWGWLPGGLLLMLACAINQSFLSFAACLAIASLAIDWLCNEHSSIAGFARERVLPLALVGLTGVVAYMISLKLMAGLTGVELTRGGGASLAALASAAEIGHRAGLIATGLGHWFLQSFGAIAVLVGFVVLIAAAVRMPRDAAAGSHLSRAGVIATAVVLIAFVAYLHGWFLGDAAASAWWPRSSSGVLVIGAMAAVLAVGRGRSLYPLKAPGIAVALALVFMIGGWSLVRSAEYEMRRERNQAGFEMARSVMDTAAAQPGYSIDLPMYVAGRYRLGTFNAHGRRVTRDLIPYVTGEAPPLANRRIRARADEHLAQMPVWPAEGSVIVVPGEYVVVNLGEPEQPS